MESLISELFKQGGGYVLAAFIFFFYRMDVKNTIRNLRDQKDTMIKALVTDTEVKARLTTVVESLAMIVEHCEIRRIQHTIADEELRRRK
jgi:hypothetical protein